MNESRLVLRKDLLYVITSIKSVIFLGLIFSFCFPLMGIGMTVTIPGLMGYVMIYSIMAYEERSKGELLNAALPVTRKAICQAKYIEALIYLVIATVIAQISTLILLASKQIPLRNGVELVMTLIPVTIFIGCVYNGIILPCIFKFGVIKARYYLMASYVIIFCFSNTLGTLEGIDTVLNEIKRLQGVLPLLLLIIGVVIYYISYQVSIKIWKSKDFK